MLAPATRRRYWKGLIHVQIEVIDIGASAEVRAALVACLVQTHLRQRVVQGLAGVLLNGLVKLRRAPPRRVRQRGSLEERARWHTTHTAHNRARP